MSALRINLLPAYIADVRRTTVAIVVASVVLALVVAGTLAFFFQLKTATESREAEANDMEQQATTATTEVNGIKSEAAGLRAKIAPIQDKVKFVNDVRFYNTWVEKVYRRAARYTDANVEYSSMAVSGGGLSMNGYAKNVDELARYLITFYGNPDVTAVTISGPPGWERPSDSVAPSSTPAVQWIPFTVSATLLRSLQRPDLPQSMQGEAGSAAAGGSASKAPAAGGGNGGD